MTFAEPYSLFLAMITKSYVSNGRPVIDCDSYGFTPLSWTEVPVVTIGGGKTDNISHRPLPASEPDNEFDVDASEGAQAVLLVSVDRPYRAFCIGTIHHPENDIQDHAEDWYEKFSGSEFIVGSNGSYTANLEEASSGEFSVKLPSGGKMKISTGGSSSDGVAKFSELKLYLQQLESYLASLEARLATQFARLPETGGPVLPGAPFATSSGPTVTDAMKSSVIDLSPE